MTSTTDATILWLDDPAAADVSRVGGKAANLSMLAARHPVPPGFCLTPTCFEELSPEGIDENGEPDPSLLPASLRAHVAGSYRALGELLGATDPAVAVRSSGLDEDGAQTSFAGQFETYLNVSGLDHLYSAILACWASGWAGRVRAYRENHGLEEGAGVAVLVQELVPADVAAVVFSANPVSGSRDEVMINASHGLGESIVGGTVTPDTFVVRKSDLSVVHRQLARKQRMTVRVPGGTREVNVPGLLQSVPALDDGQIREVAELAVNLEAAMGRPVDVECAYTGRSLFLLQCRPITTLR